MFNDKNLQLAILDATQKKYDWVDELQADYESLRKDHADWPAWAAIEDNEYDLMPALESFLLTLPVEPTMSKLVLDGDRSVYSWIFPVWHDGSDDFVVRDLTGIEVCKELEELRLGQGMTEGCSLKPLAALPNLRVLHFCASGNHRDVDALLESKSLKELHIFDDDSAHSDWALWRQVAAIIAER